MMEFDDMEAFYASLESSSVPTSPLKTNPSEETQTYIHALQYLVSKKFSYLFHPKHSIAMKDNLNYLLSLPPEKAFSVTIKSQMQQLLLCFTKWRNEYHNAGVSATSELSKAKEVGNELEANVKEFKEMEKEEKFLSQQLADLEEEKRELEEKINATKTKREKVVKRKVELFHKGREVKAKRDDLRVKVPRLKAEKQLAKITRARIEAEWFKLQKQFIGNTGIRDWI